MDAAERGRYFFFLKLIFFYKERRRNKIIIIIINLKLGYFEDLPSIRASFKAMGID